MPTSAMMLCRCERGLITHLSRGFWLSCTATWGQDDDAPSAREISYNSTKLLTFRIVRPAGTSS